MKIEPDSVEKPLRKLRKQLDTFPSNPHPEEVHALRTQTRRLEATVAALVVDPTSQSRRLIKVITSMRKAAGKVRDMDVLIGELLKLSGPHGDEGLVRLLRHLAKIRVRSARKLHALVRRQGPKARRSLKESTKLLKERLKEGASMAHWETAPKDLIRELSRWPILDASNLHDFRIKIKELRYMLQLSDEADAKLVAQLGDVKDSIGEWHDWVELQKIAMQVLDSKTDAGVLGRIEHIGEEKFKTALQDATGLRETYLEGAARSHGRKGPLRLVAVSDGATSTKQRRAAGRAG